MNYIDNDINGVKGDEIQLPEEPPTLKEIPEEVKSEETEPEIKTEETKTEETETGESKKGFTQRVRELNQAKKEAEAETQKAKEEIKSLSERLAEITSPIGQEQGQPAFKPHYQEGQEVPVEQLQRDVTSTADAIVNLRIKQNNAVNQIGNDARDALSKYPELDPKREEFNQELSEAIYEAVEKESTILSYDNYGKPVRTVNVEADVSKVVDRLMKPYHRAVNKEVGQVTENIAKQVSETALRPPSVRKQEKPAEDKTIAGLEEELGVVQA